MLSFKLTVGLVSIAEEDMTTNEAIAHFNPKSQSFVSLNFMFWSLQSYDYERLGSTSSIGTALNSKIVKAMPILVPESKLLARFDRETSELLKSMRTLRQQNNRLEEARDILLPRLMTGMIDVEELDVELPMNA